MPYRASRWVRNLLRVRAPASSASDRPLLQVVDDLIAHNRSLNGHVRPTARAAKDAASFSDNPAGATDNNVDEKRAFSAIGRRVSGLHHELTLLREANRLLAQGRDRLLKNGRPTTMEPLRGKATRALLRAAGTMSLALDDMENECALLRRELQAARIALLSLDRHT